MFGIFDSFSFSSRSTDSPTVKVEPKLSSFEPKTSPNPFNLRNPVEAQLSSITARFKSANMEIKSTQHTSQIKFQEIIKDLED